MNKFFKFIANLFSTPEWIEPDSEYQRAIKRGMTGISPEQFAGAFGRGPEGVTGIQGVKGATGVQDTPIKLYPGNPSMPQASQAAFKAGGTMPGIPGLSYWQPDAIKIIDITNSPDMPWNKNGKRWKKDVNYKKDIDTIIVHQSASGSKDDLDGINLYQITGPNHLGPEGAPHICYDYGICKNGEICQLNAPEDVLWSNVGGNLKGIAVVIVGNFTAHDHEGNLLYQGTDEPTAAQIRSLKNLIHWLCRESDFHTMLDFSRVYGHTDFGKLTCPGDTLNALVTDIRRRQQIV
jgi:hypothetical protein